MTMETRQVIERAEVPSFATPQEEPQETRIFGDIVIEKCFLNWQNWRILGRMLNFGDMKACREVCKTFNWMVLNKTNFKSRALVTLTPTTMNPDTFGTTDILFVNFNLKFDPQELIKACSIHAKEMKKKNMKSASNDPFSWLYPHLEETETLCLRLMPGTGVQQLQKTNPEHIFAVTQELIVAAKKKLKYLGIELIFLGKYWDDLILQSQYLDHPDLYNFSLDCLEILENWGKWISAKQFDNSPFFHSTPGGGTIPVKVPSLFRRVRRLKLPRLMPQAQGQSSLQNSNYEFETKYRIAFAELIQLTCSHQMEEICSLGDARFDSVGRRNFILITTSTGLSVLYPKLKSVNILESSITAPNACGCRIFYQQPEVEEVCITVRFGHFFPHMINTVRQHCSKLQKLTLRASRFESVLQKKSYWKFLETSNLREFGLEMEKFPESRVSIRRESMGFPRAALKSLPGTVQKIVIRGIPDWTLNPKIGAKDFPGILKNLTLLALSNCGGCVDDKTVEYICKNFKRLRTLDLTGAVHCTDYGFTGVRSANGSPDDFCLSNIKGLKQLILRGCTGLTEITLKEGIKFLELKYLDIVNLYEFTSEEIQTTLLPQNPSLETLLTSDLTLLEKNAELIAHHPRLKSIICESS